MVFRNIFLVPFMWVKLCYMAAHVDKFTDKQHLEMLRYITIRANKGGNVIIDAHGLENIPKEGAFMLFPNHQGMYDMLAIINVIPRPISVVMKKEVANVPFLKQVLSCVKGYAIDRENVRQGMEVIINMTKDLKNGKNFVIFPEGTRSKDKKMKKFKETFAILSKELNVPVVPVAIAGSESACYGKSIVPRFWKRIDVDILDPVMPTEEQTVESFRDKVASLIEKRLKK